MFRITRKHMSNAIIVLIVLTMVFLSYTEDQNTALSSLERTDSVLELVADSDGTYTIIMNGDTSRYSMYKRTQLY